MAKRNKRLDKRLCVKCEKRKALHWRGIGPKKLRWSSGHQLCQRCYKAMLDREMPLRSKVNREVRELLYTESKKETE